MAYVFLTHFTHANSNITLRSQRTSEIKDIIYRRFGHQPRSRSETKYRTYLRKKHMVLDSSKKSSFNDVIFQAATQSARILFLTVCDPADVCNHQSPGAVRAQSIARSLTHPRTIFKAFIMKLHFRHLTLAWYSCHHLLFLTSNVAGRGEEEEDDEQVLRPSSEWLEAFYSNVDNVLIAASLTPAASDLPDLPEDYIPPQTTTTTTTTTTTGDGTSNDAEESSTRPTTTKPPEMNDKKSGRRRLGRWLQGLLPGQQQQQQAQAIGLNILFNSDGIPYQPLSPPDTVGDVGKDHYVQMTNSAGGSAVRVLNKSDGSLNKTFELDGLGGSGTPCATGLGDPIVLYDQLASRWFLSEFGAVGNILCVYISTSDNAAGTYWRYEFPTPNFPDYPKYGVWTDAYYVGTNEPDTAAMYALERSPMLLGAPAKMVRNAGPTPLGGFGFQMMPPVDADGSTPPPTGPGLFVRHVDDESHDNYETNSASDLFEIYSLAVNFATLTSTLTLLQTIQVTEFDSNLCGLTSFSCIPQPGAGNKVFLDPLREVVMNRPQYRNFGTERSVPRGGVLQQKQELILNF
jgi:hypothetical protein